MTPADRQQITVGLGLWVVLALAWWLWRPGLGAGFIFDDYYNLTGLSALWEGEFIYRLVQYAGDGISSSLGRPLTLLTFGLQHHSWRDHPADFIHVNLCLHLLNGVLLFWWLRLWLRLRDGDATPAPWLPLAVTGLWLLAPLHVSGVLYVVQRMALLSGTFVLAGLALHTHGRIVARDGGGRRGLAWMTTGALAAIGLGTLSKENAVLYPLHVLVFETLLLSAVARPAGWMTWSRIVLGMPLLLLGAYLLLGLPGQVGKFEFREFTLAERVLTEPRVLWTYLLKLFFPPLFSARLLYDDLATSTSLLVPWTTLPAIAAWAGVVTVALVRRRQWPMFCFAVLWFLAAHVLESTYLPLELAFEHRNYLASIGPLLFAASLVRSLLRWAPARRLRAPLAAACLGYAGLVATCLWNSASLWGDPREQSRHWFVNQQDSRRAALIFTAHLLGNQLVEPAYRLVLHAGEKWPRDIMFPLYQLQIHCQYPEVPAPDLDRLAARMAVTDSPPVSVVNKFQGVFDNFHAGYCADLGTPAVDQLLDAASTSPALSVVSRQLRYLNALAAHHAGDLPRARLLLDRVIRAEPNLNVVKLAITWSIEADDTERAWHYLTLAEPGGVLSPRVRWLYRREIEGHRQLIRLYGEIRDFEQARRQLDRD